MSTAELWNLEHRLWLEGSSVYEAHLHPACIMAFPGMGIVRAAEILEGLEGAPRWDNVDITERVAGEAGDGVVVLGYRAAGHREGAEPYEVLCTTTYCAENGTWKLLQHQQTRHPAAATE